MDEIPNWRDPSGDAPEWVSLSVMGAFKRLPMSLKIAADGIDCVRRERGPILLPGYDTYVDVLRSIKTKILFFIIVSLGFQC